MFQDLSDLVHRQAAMIDKQAAMIEEQSIRIQQLKDEKDREVEVRQTLTSCRVILNFKRIGISDCQVSAPVCNYCWLV